MNESLFTKMSYTTFIAGILVFVIIKVYEIFSQRRIKRLLGFNRKQEKIIDAIIHKSRILRKYMYNMEQALAYLNNDKISAENIIKIQLFLLFISFGLTIYLRNIYIFIPMTILFLWVPLMIINEIKNRAIDAYDKQVLDFIQIFSSELAATKSVIKALEKTTKRIEPPLRYELEKLVLAIHTGENPTKALNKFKIRVENKWIKMLSNLISIYYEKGGELVPYIIRLGEDITNEKIIIQKNKTEITTMRLTNTVINSLLPLFLVINIVLNPQSIEFFKNTATGKILLTITVILTLISFYLTQMIVES
ncbi:MAG: type II secretion system F family protein [Thermovenabulum sp.]|uniref:type II secretion system F family protein n=1 Tax=Thermovenabulum sp. TaxID=3100335 RepID=UPI003C79ED98